MNLDIECDGQTMQIVDAYVAASALDTADIGRMDVRALGECLLRPLPLGSEFANTRHEVVPPGRRRG